MASVRDLGPPISYLVLEPGAPVYASDGRRVGKVARVLAAEDKDIFDGVVVDARGGQRFVDAPEVASLHERGVVLAVDAEAFAALPPPGQNAATVRAEPGGEGRGGLRGALRRAWDYLSGRY